MPKSQAIAFFEEISKNQQLAKDVEKVVSGKNSDEAKAKELLSLAKKHNFNFTKEEAASAQEALKKPLSPKEMLEVSGGKLNLKSSLMAASILIGMGFNGAMVSNMEASAMKRTLGRKRGIYYSEQIERTGRQQQTTPQTFGETNSTQQQTPSSDSQAPQRSTVLSTSMPSSTADTALSPPQEEKKAWANRERDNETAKRYSGVDGCGSHHVNWARRVSSTGALPAEDWPAAHTANDAAKKEVCRFCGGTLSARGKKARDVKCANAGCIYNWVFSQTGDKGLNGKQRGKRDFGHYVRWALLPALILDSRLPTIGSGLYQRPWPAAIMTPAEAWAVWQLIVGHNNGWADVRTMMAAHYVASNIQGNVVRLLEESYDNLVQGNEHLRAIGLGSEVQQLVEGEQEKLRATMENRFLKGKTGEKLAKAKKSIDIAVKLMEHAYNTLTDEQLQRTGYDPTQIPRHPEDALAEIKAAHQRFEIAMQQEKARRQEEAKQARETLQSVDTLTDKQKKEIASRVARSGLVTCRCKKAPGGKGCGSSNVYLNAPPRGNNMQFRCKNCGKTFSYQLADLLAMLPDAAPGNAPVEMVPAEQNEPQMQMMPESPSVIALVSEDDPQEQMEPEIGQIQVSYFGIPHLNGLNGAETIGRRVDRVHEKERSLEMVSRDKANQSGKEGREVVFTINPSNDVPPTMTTYAHDELSTGSTTIDEDRPLETQARQDIVQSAFKLSKAKYKVIVADHKQPMLNLNLQNYPVD